MFCPVCRNKSTRVVDSRLIPDGSGVRRRRECERTSCGYRFSTIEEIDLVNITVIKRDARRESYSRSKLISGLKQSLQKRPFTDAQFHALISKIERDIQKERSGEITSIKLGEIVMKHLRAFDKIAYIRFASVYHSFEDLKKFEEELQKLLKKRR
jgi:transcriptional repressor NrdR